jgi:hypothetical protein
MAVVPLATSSAVDAATTKRRLSLLALFEFPIPVITGVDSSSGHDPARHQARESKPAWASSEHSGGRPGSLVEGRRS